VALLPCFCPTLFFNDRPGFGGKGKNDGPLRFAEASRRSPTREKDSRGNGNGCLFPRYAMRAAAWT
jgi:hypothetical protein